MTELTAINFNCTIQELKLEQLRTLFAFEVEFQLHHTGIKTCFI